MRVTVNGAERELAASNIAALLIELSIAPEGCAVELNESVVPRARHASQALSEGDCIEIVRLVGGG